MIEKKSVWQKKKEDKNKLSNLNNQTYVIHKFYIQPII